MFRVPIFNYAVFGEVLSTDNNCYRQNTIRLWLPQLFAIVEEYFIINKSASGNVTMCDMLASHTGPKVTFNETLTLADAPCVPVS
jgi:hypothetical protein